MKGKLRGIFIAREKGQVMTAVDKAFGIAGQGLEHDRYSLQLGSLSKSSRPRDITLIEQETIEALKRDYKIEVAPKDLRRNLLTEGIALNHFVGKRLQVGEIIIEGVELCEPCGYLSNLLNLPLKEALKHRGGLRGKIVTSGAIALDQDILSCMQ